jgi:PncC family amidohydrolase
MVEHPSIESEVAELLLTNRLTLALAESSTGGLLGDLLTNIAGSSAFFLGGVVAYSYSAKTILLDISPEFLLEHDSVSRPVALAMARNIRTRMNADVGLAETGILGPGGSSPGKPVGTCFIAIATGRYETSRQFEWNGDRISNKRATAISALILLKEYLLGQRDLHP